MSDVEDVRSMVMGGKAVLGADRVLKLLRQGKLVKVFVSSNAPVALKDDVGQLSGGDVPVIGLDLTNEELGTLCKKPFSISIIGVVG